MKSWFILLSWFFIFINSISFAQDTYRIKKAAFCSDKYDEFSPVYYKNGLVFCSDQNPGLIINFSTSLSKGLFKISYADTSSRSEKDVRLFSGSLTSRFNDGPVTFSAGGDTIYYSRNIGIDGNSREVSGTRNKLGLFYAVYDGKKWTEIDELRFNSDSYNVTTPYLSYDGKLLFFASDKPEGLGGSDLYMCRWTNGYWSNPANLGPVINTKGNEAYPFVNQAGDIFFSSDGHPGLGGKDIYFSKFVDSAWITPVKLDPPVNSESNDFGFIADEKTGSGYFSSDRAGSLDIYNFRTNIPQLFYCSLQKSNSRCISFPDDISIDIDPLNLQFQWNFGDGIYETGYVVSHCFAGPGKYTVRQNIIDRKTGKLVYNKLILNIELKDVEQPFIEAENAVILGNVAEFNAEKSYFAGKEITSWIWDFGDGVKSSGKSARHSYASPGQYNVKLAVNTRIAGSARSAWECISKNIKVVSDSAVIKSDTSKPALMNLSDHENAQSDTVYSSSYEISKNAVFQVVLRTSKSRISLNDNLFSDVSAKYTLREFYDSERNVFYYTSDEGINFMDIYPSFADAINQGFKDALIKTYIPVDSAERQLWDLKRKFGTSSDNIFSGNNANIASGKIQLLDQLALFLNKYPGIILKIAVFTDNSGSSAANLSLSENRARNIEKYLTNKGVGNDRIFPAGYGGSRPVASNFSEADRKKNRRVDFIILSNNPAK